MDILGILLCGGAARRFGGDKLLAGTPPIAARAARNLMAGAGPVLAVVPLETDRLATLLEEVGCEVLRSERTARGMGASLAAAIEAAAERDGWIVALGDMPAISPATIAQVKRALESGARIAAPAHADGRRGHPVGFAASMRDELRALDGDVGARDLVRRHAGATQLLTTTDEGIFVDIDTPADLEKLARS